MDSEPTLAYSSAVEQAACAWVGKCINKQIKGYEVLGNGIDLLNLLSAM